MKRKSAESILLFSPDLENLRDFAQAMNTEKAWVGLPGTSGRLRVEVDYRSTQAELCRLVASWRDSGPNVTKLFEKEKELQSWAQNVQSSLIATRSARAKLVCIAAPTNMKPDNSRFNAIGLFLSFLLNPYNERLGGPCIVCGTYFVKKTNRKLSKYCSPVCGKKNTSKLANQNRRAMEREERKRSVRCAILEWSKSKSKEPWKDWVSRKSHVSKNWITRAMIKHEIQVPPIKAKS